MGYRKLKRKNHEIASLWNIQSVCELLRFLKTFFMFFKQKNHKKDFFNLIILGFFIENNASNGV